MMILISKTSVSKDTGKLEHFHTVVKNINGVAGMQNNTVISQKIKNRGMHLT